MAMYQFEFISRDGHVEAASDICADLEQASDRCRALFEGLGRATGIRSIRVRAPRGPILYSWPEGATEPLEQSFRPPAIPRFLRMPEFDKAA
jgi:hypothetical protein